MIEVITNSSVQAFTGAFQYGRADTEVFQNEIVTEIFSNEILTEIFQYEIVTENNSVLKYFSTKLLLKTVQHKSTEF